MRTLIITLAIVLWVTNARADEWVTPTTKTLTSPNKKWVAVITPARDPKAGVKATITPAGGQPTTITLASKWAPVDAVLFDDGTLLTLDQWHQLGYGKVAQLYERDGTVRWSKTLQELVGQTFIETADHSVSSIWWRKTPLEWSLSKDGKTGLITLFDENQLQLTVKDGTAIIVVVGNLPDDPVRQLNRARALAKQDGQGPAAIAVLEKMLAKDPEHYEALYVFLEVAHRLNDHSLAVAMLDRVSPRWKRKDAGYSLANVCVLWSTSLLAVSRAADAERVLRQGAATAPSYPNPVLALGKLLYDQKRKAEADAALDDFVGRALKQSYVDQYALTAVADFYRQRKDPRKALAIYQKGYKKTEVTNQFLYASLAQVYEELGQIGEAIKIQEQLLAYFQKQGSAFDSYAKSTRDELARLRAKP